MPLDGGPLVDWQFLPSEPAPTQPPEQVGMRARRDEMRLQDGMHLVLDPGPMPNDKAAPLLNAFRGAAPRDVGALVAAMVALSRFAGEHAGRLMSVEVNPLIVHEQDRGATAVDARLVLG